MNRILSVLLVAAVVAIAGPTTLVITDEAPQSPARYFGRVGRYLLLEDVPTASGRLLALNPDQPTYIVYLHGPGIEPAIERIAPALLKDNRVLLLQLDAAQRQAVSLAGAELFQLPDEPIPLPAAEPPVYPRALRPDTVIERLVNQVNPDSVRGHIQRLVNFRTRYTFSDSCRSAERYIYDYFTRLGLDSVVLDPYVVQGETLYNAVGMIRGTRNPDRLVIICGHLDCTSETPASYAPGAEDNASGTAMALEAARVLANETFETSVMFIGFSGEEQGLWGSFNFARKLALQRRPVVGVLNFDMIAWPGGQFGVTIHCDSLSQPLAEFEARMAATYTALDWSVDQSSYGSDQLAFMYFGYPATAGAEYGSFYPWYHTTADTIGNLDFNLAAEVCRMAVATAAALGTAPAAPVGFELRDNGTGGSLAARWRPSPSADVVGYKLLWGTTSQTYTDSIILPNTTSYDITGLVNGTRYYAICVAIDSSGREGFPTPERSAVPGTTPLAPVGFAVLPIRWGNRLTWQSNQELDIDGYNLYRSTQASTGFVRLNTSLLADTTYTDSGLQADTMYYYYATAVDTQGLESDTSAHGRAKPITLDHGILLVDETRDGNGNPGSPSDAQQDAFYHRCLQGATYTDWDCAARGAVPLAGDIGPYSTVVWIADDYTQQQIRPALAGLANYLGQGGRLWYSGWRPLTGILPPNPTFPVTFAPGTFGYNWLHLGQAGQCAAASFIGAIGTSGYPDLGTDSAKMYPSQRGRLTGVETTYPRDAEPIYTFNSSAGDTFQDKPVGVRWLGEPGRVVLLGFPLYYMNDSAARQAAIRILTDLGEAIGIEEGPALTTSSLAGPTIVGTILQLPATIPNPASGIFLIDATGRKVLDLLPGPNDVSSLSAGVYFLVPSAGAECQPTGIRKVIRR